VQKIPYQLIARTDWWGKRIQLGQVLGGEPNACRLHLLFQVAALGAEILEIFTIGEKSENGGREHLFRETGLTIKTLLRTSLEKLDGRIFSKVDRVQLGGMPAQLAEEVATYFPPGFCIYGSGGDVGSR
jgi:hypothetical protein